MNEIKKLTKDGIKLTHSWYINFMGFKQNAFDLFDEKSRTHYPFFGPIRVNTLTADTPIGGDDCSPYSDEEYAAMLDEQIKKLEV